MNFKAFISSFLAAFVFYTIIPLPQTWQLNWRRIARWAPLIGLVLGSLLVIVDISLASLATPILARSTLIVGLWVWLTGGLHLDGVADTADGLAVLEPERRLQVMQDSVTGAFGVMAVVLVLLLKVAGLADLTSEYRPWIMINAAAWGRWGQVAAIAFYPYLKSTGKGAFHKQSMRFPQDLWWGLLPLLGLNGWLIWQQWLTWQQGIVLIAKGIGIALFVGFWIYRRFGGHTGDTYGAVVEWTETLFLISSV